MIANGLRKMTSAKGSWVNLVRRARFGIPIVFWDLLKCAFPVNDEPI